MSNPDLPDDLLAKIAKLMAAKHWWYLQLLLRAGKRGRKIVYWPEVLKEANNLNMCSDPDDIKVAGRHRKFFERCIEARNPMAIYFEGLRLVTQVGDIDGALKLLQRNVPSHADATLACALFCIYNGYSYQAAIFLRLFSTNYYQLDSEEVGEMCEELIGEIRKYGPPYNNTYGVYFDYHDNDEITTPPCAMKCALTAYISVEPPYKHPCNKCQLWWCARRISQML